MDRADGARLRRCAHGAAKVWPCVHTRGVFTRRRSERARKRPRERRTLSGRAICADSVGDMDRADGARLRRCAHGAAKTLAVRPHARRVPASPPRARSAIRRFVPGSATWTERMVCVSDVARMARPKLWPCAHTRGVFTRRRPERARERRTLSGRAIHRFVPGSATWTERTVRV